MRVVLLLVQTFYKRLPLARFEEDQKLIQSLALTLVDRQICTVRGTYDPATLMGKGWVERMRLFVEEEKIDLVVIDPDLSSLQMRNLEKIWGCKVWDRTGLILAIFENRALSRAGKLQVMLARLFYQKSRLVRAWSHLERQRGGFGFMGGPGESQLELDRRMLDQRIMRIKDELNQVRKTRTLSHKGRRNFFKIALVGYTNAGKSTLFRCLSRTDTLVADQPFATLDPLVRKIFLPEGQPSLLSDTVGFISQLPRFLKLAFQATLEELKEADLILHVRDMACQETLDQKKAVEEVLIEIGCQAPILEVLNKEDKMSLNAENETIQGETDQEKLCYAKKEEEETAQEKLLDALPEETTPLENEVIDECEIEKSCALEMEKLEMENLIETEKAEHRLNILPDVVSISALLGTGIHTLRQTLARLSVEKKPSDPV